MKRGDIVIIYQDPITELKPEGRVKLVEFIKANNGLELWRVRFLSDNFTANRFIKTGGKNEQL